MATFSILHDVTFIRDNGTDSHRNCLYHFSTIFGCPTIPYFSQSSSKFIDRIGCAFVCTTFFSICTIKIRLAINQGDWKAIVREGYCVLQTRFSQFLRYYRQADFASLQILTIERCKFSLISTPRAMFFTNYMKT